MRFPLMMRDGSVPGAIEPGLRWRVLPCVSGPPPKWWRCTTPWKPRPFVTPVTLTRSPAVKIVTVSRSPGLGGGASPTGGRAKLCSTRGAVSRPARFTCPARALCVRFGFFAPKPSWSWAAVTCTTGHGPASITVTGTWAPSASNTRVMPSFRPMSPFMSLFDLDLDVHARGQVELGQGIDRLGARIENVDQPLVRLELELLSAFLVDVRAAQHRPQLPLGRQRDGSRDLRARLLGRADDVGRGLVDQGVVECLETDANFARHGSPLFQDLGDHAGAHRAAALADREPHLLLQRDRRDQLALHLRLVPRHHHLHPVVPLHRPRHILRPKVHL